ncbi:MAG: hypothetical protein PHI19_00185 [Clostridia bacterium]|nr:hypothetical protein [Clostridia bacterium]
MAIIKSTKEVITSYKPANTPSLEQLAQIARETTIKWKDTIVDNSNGCAVTISPALQVTYPMLVNGSNDKLCSDITDTAFYQLCSRVGVPSKYVCKCFEAGKTELALNNFSAWAGECKSSMLVRSHEGVVRACLSSEYSTFDIYQVLRALSYTVDTERFVPSQVFMSSDRLHIRFVDYTPIHQDDGSPLFAGFVVDTSDIGQGSLSMKFFLYRMACMNGLVISSMGGTLFRLNHVGEKMSESKIALFSRAFADIDRLAGKADILIGSSRKIMLKDYELAMYIERARRELKLSAEGVKKMEGLISYTYSPTLWGLISSVSELAQDFSLEQRVQMEGWAGELLVHSAAR